MRPAMGLLLALAACDAPLTTPSSAPPSPVPLAAPERAPPALVAAPLAATEAPASRRQAVLDVLTDGRSAAALAIVANEPNEPFDPNLADTLTPMVPIERPIPAVFHRAYTVTGPLAKDVVRRIVRSHINEVRYCYNQGVARNPKLRGTVVVDFTISLTGKVSASVVRSSTLTDPKVDTCIVESTRRWVFPKPSGGTADVSYEFDLVLRQSQPTAD
jgi:TonB family protein